MRNFAARGAILAMLAEKVEVFWKESLGGAVSMRTPWQDGEGWVGRLLRFE